MRFSKRRTTVTLGGIALDILSLVTSHAGEDPHRGSPLRTNDHSPD